MRNSTRIIACAVVAEELKALGVAEACLTTLEFGLHVSPEKLKRALQREIDAIPGEGEILLGYGLCSNAVVGLRSATRRLVIPRLDDCIALFLGSREEYVRRLAEEPGTYFLTKGWIEAGDLPFAEYRGLVEKYGEKRAARVAKAMLANYKRMALIDTGNFRREELRARAREIADFFGLRLEEIPGSKRLLLKMLAGEWDEEFLIVPVGAEITAEDFRRGEGAE